MTYDINFAIVPLRHNSIFPCNVNYDFCNKYIAPYSYRMN